jgi:hypothetical protein
VMTSSVSSNRWLLAILLVLPLLFARPRSGHADVGHDFRQHYEAALRLYDHGQFEGAIKEFQAAYTLKQLPRLLLNIGQTHRKLGHARDALGFYEFYLRVEPNPKPEIKAELTTYIAQTRALLDAAERMRAQQEPPEPPPQNEPPLARRTPDGSAVIPTPFVLIPPPPTPAERLAVAVTPAAQPQLRTPMPTPNMDQAGGRPVYKKWWFWTLIGIGVAGAATGIALGVRAATASSDPANIEIRNVF